jgi:hypothetical protein
MKIIQVLSDEGIVDIKVINQVEEIMGFKFPNDYKDLLSNHNGLYLQDGTFKYFDEVVEREEENGIYFYAFANENLDCLYCDGIVGDFSYIDRDF